MQRPGLQHITTKFTTNTYRLFKNLWFQEWIEKNLKMSWTTLTIQYSWKLRATWEVFVQLTGNKNFHMFICCDQLMLRYIFASTHGWRKRNKRKENDINISWWQRENWKRWAKKILYKHNIVLVADFVIGVRGNIVDAVCTIQSDFNVPSTALCWEFCPHILYFGTSSLNNEKASCDLCLQLVICVVVHLQTARVGTNHEVHGFFQKKDNSTSRENKSSICMLITPYEQLDEWVVHILAVKYVQLDEWIGKQSSGW